MELNLSEDMVLLELNARWHCDLPWGWVPINCAVEDFDAVGVDAIEIYDARYFEYFEEDLYDVLANDFGITSLYAVHEGGGVSVLPLKDCYFCYGGPEYLYTDAAFSFVLYFSHESSVTIGGTNLLSAIHRMWPEHANHFWDWEVIFNGKDNEEAG